jgi:hypothetical protein
MRQKMEMDVKIDPVAEGLEDGDDPGPLPAPGHHLEVTVQGLEEGIGNKICSERGHRGVGFSSRRYHHEFSLDRRVARKSRAEKVIPIP